MLFPSVTASEKRKAFRAKLKTGKLLQFPGSWSPLVSMAIEKEVLTGFTFQALSFQMIWDIQTLD